MNSVYNKVLKVLSTSDHDKLQVAQRLWIRFRDANCTAERELYGEGSAAPMVYAACLAADTRQRTAELKEMQSVPHRAGCGGAKLAGAFDQVCLIDREVLLLAQ